MKAAVGIAVIVLGVISSGLFLDAGRQLADSGEQLTALRSVGGASVAEAYYQQVGRYGIAHSRLAYALGVGALMLSLGLGGPLISRRRSGC